MSVIWVMKKQGTKENYFISLTFQPTVFFRESSEEDSWLKH